MNIEELAEQLATQNKWFLKDGKLFEKRTGDLAQQHEVLNTPEISIKSREGCTQAFDGEQFLYSFELNHAPCDVWIKLFLVSLHEDPRTEIQGHFLRFECFKDNLPAKHKRVKDAIEKTNTSFERVKKAVVDVLQAEEKRFKEKQKQDEERLKIARDEFDKLEL